MLSNSEKVSFVYLKVPFAEPKNKLSILSSISFLHYESQKNKIFETFWNLDNKFSSEMPQSSF